MNCGGSQTFSSVKITRTVAVLAGLCLGLPAPAQVDPGIAGAAQALGKARPAVKAQPVCSKSSLEPESPAPQFHAARAARLSRWSSRISSLGQSDSTSTDGRTAV